MRDENSEIQDFDYNRDLDDVYGGNQPADAIEQQPEAVSQAQAINANVETIESADEERRASFQPQAINIGGGEDVTEDLGPSSTTGALLGGIIGAAACALIWTLITVITHYKIGYVALGVGFAVGYVVYRMGKGRNLTFALISGIFSLLACFLGDYFSMIVFIAEDYNESYFSVLSGFSLSDSFYLMQHSLEIVDLFFYAIAAYTGFKFAYKA